MKRGNWTDGACYYVSVIDGDRFGLLLGPFRSEAECRRFAYCHAEDGGELTNNNLLRSKMYEVDNRSWFYSVGMVKMKNGHREGVLNSRIGKAYENVHSL